MILPKSIDVDILVANYNNAPYLKTFFDSIISSSVIPHKLVIVNDGSSDNSEEIIKYYSSQYAFIQPIYLKRNRGFANALNEGIKILSSSYTIRVDPDDYIYPTRIEEQYNFITKYNYDLVGSNIQYFDSKTSKNLFKSNVATQESQIVKYFKSGSCGIIHGSSIIKTDLLKKYGYSQENVPAEDYELFSKIIIGGGHVANMKDTLTAVRVHINSVSNSLPFSTIAKTFSITEKLWGIRHNYISIYIRYIHLKNYRNFLFESNYLKKYVYLTISCLMSPSKVLKRFLR